MSRSCWIPLFLHPEFIIQKQKNQKAEHIVLYNRATVITKQMLGLKLDIYNGIRFFNIIITNDMIGHSVGEFSPTRKKPLQKKTKNK
jgi:small subunit ribosomal protein S19